MDSTTNNAFLAQYKGIHNAFVRYCSSRAYGILETEDLVQEAVLATLKNFDRLQDSNKLLAYMIGVVNNILRNKRRRARFQGEWDDKILRKLESQAPSPEIALDIHFLLKAMDQLPEKQKEAILLFEVSGFSIKEISELQQSSESATKTRLSRGRKELRKLMSEKRPASRLSATLASFTTILF